MIEPGQIFPGWPLVLSMAAAVAAQGLRAGKRRTALNEAMHELRRPLQAAVLASGPGLAVSGGDGDPIELAAAALERLDREINGGPPAPTWGTIDAYWLVQSAVSRWSARARLADGSLELRWNVDRAMLSGDRCALSQALDNLIVNAIEHGGPTIVVAVRVREGLLRVAVVDSGRASRPSSPRNRPAEVVAHLSGRNRHGHGLAVVARIASTHRGSFSLQRSDHGSRAVIELPLAEVESAAA
jgi:signal transduction histidine kinase